VAVKEFLKFMVAEWNSEEWLKSLKVI
jgi:hypothetical protein